MNGSVWETASSACPLDGAICKEGKKEISRTQRQSSKVVHVYDELSHKSQKNKTMDKDQ